MYRNEDKTNKKGNPPKKELKKKLTPKRVRRGAGIENVYNTTLQEKQASSSNNMKRFKKGEREREREKKKGKKKVGSAGGEGGRVESRVESPDNP